MTDRLSLQTRWPMAHGGSIPALGLGVFQSARGDATRNAVRWALEAGYRSVDTARMYENETEVGEAIRASGVPREEVFVTTKLWHDDHGYESALKAGRASLDRLKTGYIDLYLIHWPKTSPPKKRLDTWRAMLQLRKDGVCRAVGVSNYTIRHLQELDEGSDAGPSVNQVEFHPFLYQRELLEFCRGRQIQLEAYSPLGRGRTLDDPTLGAIAQAHGRTPAQVALRWALQHGLVVIPKSVHRERIVENAAVFDFELGAAEMERIDALGNAQRLTWDPTEIP